MDAAVIEIGEEYVAFEEAIGAAATGEAGITEAIGDAETGEAEMTKADDGTGLAACEATIVLTDGTTTGVKFMKDVGTDVF